MLLSSKVDADPDTTFNFDVDLDPDPNIYTYKRIFNKYKKLMNWYFLSQLYKHINYCRLKLAK